MTTKIKASSRIILAVTLLIATAIMVCFAAQPVEQAKKQSAASLSVAERYQTQMENALSTVLFNEEAPKKEYQISATAAAAPKPDQACYGEVDSAAAMKDILEKAADILEGQDMYFSTETEIFAGSKVRYYLDETIFAVTWKEVLDHTVFTFSEVKVMHPSQFRRHLSGNEFGSGKLFTTSQMSESVNAVVACNGDYYDYRRRGVTTTNGIVHRAKGQGLDLCFIDNNGDMILESRLEFESLEAAQAYVDEHDVNFNLAFGPILVKDGEYVCPNTYPLGEVLNGFPRAAICQMGKLHYMFAVSNMEAPCYNKLTVKRFAELIHQTGCIHAYAVDGGQTGTVVMNNQVINRVNYGSERLISDIIYFATAKPAEE